VVRRSGICYGPLGDRATPFDACEVVRHAAKRRLPMFKRIGMHMLLAVSVALPVAAPQLSPDWAQW